MNPQTNDNLQEPVFSSSLAMSCNSSRLFIGFSLISVQLSRGVLAPKHRTLRRLDLGGHGDVPFRLGACAA